MESQDLFIAVRNDDGQYALWPSDLPVPAGWQALPGERSREDCLAWIATQWTAPLPTARA